MVVSATAVRRGVREVVRVVIVVVAEAEAVVTGGGPSAGTSGAGGTPSVADPPGTAATIGVTPVATPAPRTPATTVETPSADRATSPGHCRPRGWARRADVGPATVMASSSLVTSG
ncbi:hypothetical protein GCM10023203_20400 [Actinomycetospora straminea]|uniref:Secreted protein n=1 Tax=Actinomycetospora straminea TaxID=663607 RepID=A0ABP9E977_9PSEU